MVVGDVLPHALSLEAQSAEVPVLVQSLVEHPMHSVGSLWAAGVYAQVDAPIGPSCPQHLLCRVQETTAWIVPAQGCPQGTLGPTLSRAPRPLVPTMPWALGQGGWQTHQEAAWRGRSDSLEGWASL